MAMIKRIQWEQEFERYTDAVAFEDEYRHREGFRTSFPYWSRTREAYVVMIEEPAPETKQTFKVVDMDPIPLKVDKLGPITVEGEVSCIIVDHELYHHLKAGGKKLAMSELITDAQALGYNVSTQWTHGAVIGRFRKTGFSFSRYTDAQKRLDKIAKDLWHAFPHTPVPDLLKAIKWWQEQK